MAEQLLSVLLVGKVSSVSILNWLYEFGHDMSPLTGFKHLGSHRRIAQTRYQMRNNRVAVEYL